MIKVFFKFYWLILIDSQNSNDTYLPLALKRNNISEPDVKFKICMFKIYILLFLAKEEPKNSFLESLDHVDTLNQKEDIIINVYIFFVLFYKFRKLKKIKMMLKQLML